MEIGNSRVFGDFEHIKIEYGGGEMTLRFKEFNQSIKLFKDVQQYGDDCVVVSNTTWNGHWVTIRHGEAAYFMMVYAGWLVAIATPLRHVFCGNTSVVLNISNREGID